MQRSSRAPVLSATRRRDLLLDHLRASSTTSARRQCFVFESGRVSTMRTTSPDVRRVALVVRVELRRAADDLLVARVRLHRLDLDDDRLVHRGRDDDAAALLAAAALVLGLREPHDRLALALRGAASAFGASACGSEPRRLRLRRQPCGFASGLGLRGGLRLRRAPPPRRCSGSARRPRPRRPHPAPRPAARSRPRASARASARSLRLGRRRSRSRSFGCLLVSHLVSSSAVARPVRLVQ